MKFGRIYKLTLETDVVTGESIEITYPLTLELNITRTSLASVNVANLVIYNLNEDTRKKIFHDRYDTTVYRRVKLEAGYSDTGMSVIFLGNIQWAYSSRVGTEWKTEINAFDGGYGTINGNISRSYPAGYSIRQIYTDLVKAIPQTKLGSIGNFFVENSRGLTLVGNPWDELKKIVPMNANLFCDNETINIMNANEYLAEQDDYVYTVKSETGLLNIPKRANAIIDVDIIFEPRIRVCQKVNLESIEKYYNGQYKILGLSHKGIISGSAAGTLITTLNLEKPERIVAI